VKGIIAYLNNKKIIGNLQKYACYEHNFFKIRARNGGFIAYDDRKIGKLVRSGEILGRLYTKESILANRNPVDIKASSDYSALISRTSSSAVHEGDEIFKLMRNIFAL
jgi:hypothetical protein